MAGGFSVTISAVDRVTATIDRINARIGKFSGDLQKRIDATTAPFRRLGAAIAKFSDISGLTRVGSAVRGLARAGVDAYQKVGQLVPLIGIIGSAASVAGITRMVNAWTEWGSRVGFTAQRIGISADKLSALQGAARLAGSSAEGAANGLQTLGQTMYDAIGGRAPEAIVMFRTLGVAFQDASGHARSVTDVLPEVADKIKAIRDPFAQAQVATALFGGAAEDLLPFLRKGSAGIREYTEMARRYGVFSDASAAAANRMREAQARVSLAVEGLRNRIAERLEPVLAPLLTHFAEWLATSPQVAQGIDWLGQKVQQLAAWIDGGGIQRFGDTMTVWLDRIGSVTHALGGDGGAMGAVEALMAVTAGSFVLKVIAPFLSLSTAIGGVIARLTVLTAEAIPALAAAANKLPGFGAGGGAGMAGWLGRLGGIGTTLAAGYAMWQGADWLQGKTDTGQDGIANLLHNMMFDMNPMHWTQSYHPGQEGAGGSAAGRGLGSRPPPGGMDAPTGNAAAREKQAYDYFVSQGRSSQAAAGIVASLQGEGAGLDDKALGDYVNGVPTAYGIGQWHKDRQDNFARIFGHTIQKSTLTEQLQFKQMELNGTGGDAGSETAGKMMSRPGITAREAGAVDSMYAERPGDKFGQAQYRGARGEQVYARQRALHAQQAPALPAPAAPAAQGAPLSLTNGGQSVDSKGTDSTVRLELHGTMDKGMNVKVGNATGAEVSGPLVERPQLLGAMP